MTQHYPRNTVSVGAFCKKCQRETQHRVDGTRKGPCLDCIARLEAQASLPRKPPRTQLSLFTLEGA